MNANDREIRRKQRIIEHAVESGNVAKTCRYFGIPRSSFYRWHEVYLEHGEEGLRCKKPIAKSHPNQTPDEIVEKILYLRRKYHLGPVRIMWYMARYHQVRVSDATIYRVLKRHGVSRLPGKVGCRKVHTKRYHKQVPGHHIQMDVKFLIFKSKAGKKIKRYQYTAIDDATRVRALKIYDRHTQKHAIDFVDHVVAKFPFRIQQIRTDRGHEFQAQFHWHVEDLGTLVEPFENHIKTSVVFGEIIAYIRANTGDVLPGTPYYELHVPIDVRLPNRKAERQEALSNLVDWLIAGARTMDERNSGPCLSRRSPYRSVDRTDPWWVWLMKQDDDHWPAVGMLEWNQRICDSDKLPTRGMPEWYRAALQSDELFSGDSGEWAPATFDKRELIDLTSEVGA